MKKMTQKPLTLLLGICLACLLLTFSAFAAEIVDSGNCGADGDNLTWTLDSDGLLTITGSGDMADYQDDAFDNWSNSSQDIITVVIGENVTCVGYGVFGYCHEMTSCTMLGGVTEIKESAFYECSKLVNLTLPDTLTVIGLQAFTLCESLEEVVIPESVETIKFCGFAACYSLTSVNIPKNVSLLGDNVFYDCKSLVTIDVDSENQYYKCIDGDLFTIDGKTLLCHMAGRGDTSYTIPDGTKTIYGGAFSGCASLTSVTIPDSVTTIGNWAFYSTGLETVNIPKSVEIIEDAPFVTSKNLTAITVDEENPYFCAQDGVLFSIDKTTLVSYPAGKTDSSYDIPDGVETLVCGAFTHNTHLESITIPAGVTAIPREGFSGDTGLVSIELPDSVRTIGIYAFSECDNLAEIDIGEGVEYIDLYAFENCTALQSIVLPDTLTHIAHKAFNGCTSLTSVDIPDNVEVIDAYAFMNCTSLKSVKLPEKLTVVPGAGFYNCVSLESITIPSNVTSIYANAFAADTSLKTVILGSGVKHISTAAFYGCTSLENVIYLGTAEDASDVDVGKYNDDLVNAKWTFHPTHSYVSDDVLVCDVCGYERDEGFAPTASDDSSFLLHAVGLSTPALRFGAKVAKNNFASVKEFGFLATTAKQVGTADVSTLKIDGDITYVQAKPYDKANSVDMLKSDDGTDLSYTVLCANVPTAHYGTDIYVRSYLILNDGTVCYGAVSKRNFKQEAQSYKDAYTANPTSEKGKAYNADKATFDSLIGK